MEFHFNCPKCNYSITEKDFKENDKILSALKEVFNKHENNYIDQLKQKLQEDWNIQHQHKVAVELSRQQLKLNEIKTQEVNKIKGEISRYQTLLIEEQAKKEKMLLQQEKDLTVKKQKEVYELNNQILKLESLMENHKNISEKILLEKLNEIEKIKHNELKQLNDIINKQQIELSNNQVKLEKLLLEKSQEITNKKQQEIEILKQQINELKEANIQFKVIQNKTKGETFEQDVEYELRKVFEPEDIITKITTQDKKADYLHEIRKDGTIIGKIVYEVKNAEWSNAWEKKLVEDMGKQKSKYGILIATSFNKKYPNIPFKRSDHNPNIYLSDAESFYFIAQILKTLINIEYKLEIKNSQQEYQEKFKKFNDWKISELPRFTEILHSSCVIIQNNESSILKNIDKIRIAREKILNNWVKNIKDFLENVNF